MLASRFASIVSFKSMGGWLNFEAPRSFSGRTLVQRMENHDLLQDCACSEKQCGRGDFL